MIILDLLAAIGKRSQLGLIAGLVVGLAAPGVAAGMRPYLTELIVALLFFAALRIEPRAFGTLRGAIRHDVPTVLVLQFLLPLVVAGGLAVVGWTGPFATMLVLITAAAPITGSAPIAQLAGQSGATAMRMLLWGTFLLPLTSLLPLHLAFGTEAGVDVTGSALRLAGIIIVSVLGAALLRRALLQNISERADAALAGVTTIFLAVFVVALMDAVQPALLAAPLRLAGVLAFTCVVNFTLQTGAAVVYRALAGDRAEPRDAGAIGIVAGNRNIALFLAALPATQIEPLMILVGCYQIPMYLTPLVMRPVYRALGRAKASGVRPR